jgi:predicted nucleic acid-binding protein
MAVAIDACILSQFLFEHCGELIDFNTGKAIKHARERIDGLIQKVERERDYVVIPTPALSEALVVVAPDVQKYLEILHSQACFKIVGFGERAAVEVALRAKAALGAHDKKEAVKSAWNKVKYDRQIVAIAKCENVSAIYSADRDIHSHAKLWGMSVFNACDLTVPVHQPKLAFAPSQSETVTSQAQEPTPKDEPKGKKE